MQDATIPNRGKSLLVKCICSQSPYDETMPVGRLACHSIKPLPTVAFYDCQAVSARKHDQTKQLLGGVAPPFTVCCAALVEVQLVRTFSASSL